MRFSGQGGDNHVLSDLFATLLFCVFSQFAVIEAKVFTKKSDIVADQVIDSKKDISWSSNLGAMGGGELM